MADQDQATGRGRNQYFEGCHGAEEPQDAQARIALVVERDRLSAENERMSVEINRLTGPLVADRGSENERLSADRDALLLAISTIRTHLMDRGPLRRQEWSIGRSIEIADAAIEAVGGGNGHTD